MHLQRLEPIFSGEVVLNYIRAWSSAFAATAATKKQKPRQEQQHKIVRGSCLQSLVEIRGGSRCLGQGNCGNRQHGAADQAAGVFSRCPRVREAAGKTVEGVQDDDPIVNLGAQSSKVHESKIFVRTCGFVSRHKYLWHTVWVFIFLLQEHIALLFL